MIRFLLLPVLGGCGGYLTTYVPPPVTVGDITDQGDVDLTIGPRGASAVVGVADHINVRASGDIAWGVDTLTTDTDPYGEVGPDAWDVRLGFGGANAWDLGKRGQFIVAGALEGGIGHIRDFTVYDDETVYLFSDNGHRIRSARFGADSIQGIAQVSGTFQWRAVGVGGGFRMTVERLTDDGTTQGPLDRSWELVRLEPFLFVRSGWAPVFIQLQSGGSAALDEDSGSLNPAMNLSATWPPLWAAVAVELQLDRVGTEGPFFRDPRE